MFPSIPEEEYRIEIPPLKIFPNIASMFFYVRVYPDYFVFEFFVNGKNVWAYAEERKYLL